MSRVFIIGLPTAIRVRFEKAAAEHGIELSVVLAGPDRVGLKLLPYVGQAATDLEEHLHNLSDWSKARILILPYTELPDRLGDLVDMVDEQGGEVIEPEPSSDGWPPEVRRRQPDSVFYDGLFNRLCALLLPPVAKATCPIPSQAIGAVVDKHDRFVFAEGIYDVCDDVDLLRRDFVVNALEALVHHHQNGAKGGLDEFFKLRGLTHAQSGGSEVTVKVHYGDGKLKSFKTNTHLKQGDSTTPQGAARIYYCRFNIEGAAYIGVLYVGPHPEGDMVRRIML